MTGAPHRIRVERAAYELDPSAVPPPGLVEVGVDAEGRVLYGDPARRSSRKRVFLAARLYGEEGSGLVGYVRPDPPPGYGLPDVLRAAFPQPLPRPEALALLGVLSARHVVLIDGRRLGGERDALAEAVAGVALEPANFVRQATRVPEWALADALRSRWDELAARVLGAPWVRGLASPELGYVRTVAPRVVVLARSSQEPVDVGDVVEVRSRDGGHAPIRIRVVDVSERDVQVIQQDEAGDESVGHGDPAYFVPTG